MVVAQKPALCCNSKHSHEQITASSLLLSIGRLFAHKYMNGTHTQSVMSGNNRGPRHMGMHVMLFKGETKRKPAQPHTHRDSVFPNSVYESTCLLVYCIIAGNVIRCVSLCTCVAVCVCASACVFHTLSEGISSVPSTELQLGVRGQRSRCLVGNQQV